ncbi:MAG: hypothetical protein ACREN1_06680 [Candidatus Dormibacteria bacterium]
MPVGGVARHQKGARSLGPGHGWLIAGVVFVLVIVVVVAARRSQSP